MEDMQKALREIEGAIPDVTWTKGSFPVPPGTGFFRGEGRGWTINVFDFDISDQGFPAGSRGYDGAANKPGLIVHLTRELAEKAFKAALAALEER